MSSFNRYSPNSALTRLKLELQEAETELRSTSGSRRESVLKKIENIKLSIAQIEKEIDEEYKRRGGD